MFRSPLLLTASLAVLALSLSSTVLMAEPSKEAVKAPVASIPVNTKAWGQAKSDISVDPAVRFGVLPNGMQYALMRNVTPPKQIAFRLAIDAGSLMEDDNQLGLAHFMEHMAFNGSATMPGDEMIRILERHGLGFGADTNASTGFDQTVYMLNLPNGDDAVVQDSLRVMREQVSGALLKPEAIETERGVVEGEQRINDTPNFRTMDANFKFLAPGQRLSKRMPIGDLTILRTASRERFVSFYNAYYRPERATFIAVGDFDVDQMEAKIRTAFASWKGKGATGPEPDLGTVAQRGTEAKIAVEPGARSYLELSWVSKTDLDPVTFAKKRDEVIRYLGLKALDRRLRNASRGDNPPFNGASASVDDMYKSLRSATIYAQFNAGDWQRALETVEQEQRKLVQYGVTPEELTREVTEMRTRFEAELATSSTRRSSALASELVGAVNSGDVFTSPQQSLDLFNRITAGLTTATINDQLKAAFAGQGPLVFVSTPTVIDGGEPAVIAALNASRKVAVTAPAAEAAIQWPYQSFGTPGKESSRREIPELGVTIITFTNGARLTVKPTKFVDDQILINVRTGNGDLGLPTDRTTPQSLVSELIMEGGLGKLTQDQLEQALAGHVINTGFKQFPDSVSLRASTRPTDLNLQMQLITAYFTDPVFHPADLKKFQASYAQILEQLQASPSGAFGLRSEELLNSGDKRGSTLDVATVAGWTADDVKASYLKSIATGTLDVTIVGDVSIDQAIASVAGTMGAFPVRKPTPAPKAAATQVRFPAGTTQPLRLTHTGGAEQALGNVAWPTTDQVADRTEARQLRVLAAVFQLRVTDEIRERLSIAYSPSVWSSSSDTFPGYGTLQVDGETAPEKLPLFFSAVDKIAASLRDAPPSDDELQRAVGPMVEQQRRSSVTNEYWIGNLRRLTDRPQDAKAIGSEIATYEAIKPADIQRLAQKYLIPSKAWRAEVVSDKK